jgi:hypothetical protein
MSQLPKPTQVAEAQAYAHQCLEQLKDKLLVGAGPILHPETAEIFARRCFKLKAMSGFEGMMQMIEAARVYDEVDVALCELYAELKHEHLKPPPMLDTYATEALLKRRRRRRGRRKSTNLLQDVMFASLMADLIQTFGLRATRKAETHRDSAGDILAVAVNKAKWLNRSFNYKAAERLWVLWGAWVQDRTLPISLGTFPISLGT